MRPKDVLLPFVFLLILIGMLFIILAKLILLVGDITTSAPNVGTFMFLFSVMILDGIG